MIEARDEVADPVVVGACLDADRTLRRSGREFLGVEVGRDPVGGAEPVKAGDGQQRRVGNAIGELATG